MRSSTPSSNNEEIPLEATFGTIKPWDHRLANVFQVKVFPGPPYMYEKKKQPQTEKRYSIKKFMHLLDI